MSAESSFVSFAYSSHNNSTPEITPRKYPSNPNATKPPTIYNSGPCALCRLSLQKACEVVAYCGITLGVILIIAGTTVYALEPKLVDQTIIVFKDGKKAKEADNFSDVLDYSSVVNLLRGFYDLILYPMLWVAARKRRRCLLLLFIAIKLTLFCALLIGTSLIMIFFGHDYIPLCPLVLLLPEVYFLWVVLCYMEELKVVGVVGGNPLLRSEALLDIYETEMATMGYYGPGTVITADGKHVFPNYATRGGAVPSATTNATSSSVLLDSTHQDFSAASVQSVGLVRSEQSGDWGVCTSPMPPQPNKETTTTRK